MRAISLHQPWASALFTPLKPIETRGWKTDYRGPLAIHASMRCTWSEIHSLEILRIEHPEVGALLGLDVSEGIRKLPFGAIIGTVELTDCIPTAPEGPYRREENEKRFRPHCIDIPFFEAPERWGDFAPGRFGWCRTKPVLFEKPIPCIGRQRFWNWEMPK